MKTIIWGLLIALCAIGLYKMSGTIHAIKAEQDRISALPEPEYCATFGNNYSAPIKCYKYFGIEQVGVRHSGKTTKPILVPTN